jgi:hypothetical protein
MSCQAMAMTAVMMALPGQQQDGQQAGQLHGQQQQHVLALCHSVVQQLLLHRQQVVLVCQSLSCGTRSLQSWRNECRSLWILVHSSLMWKDIAVPLGAPLG